MAKKILHVDSSARYGESYSRRFSKDIVEKLGAEHVTYRDLGAGVPLITEDWVMQRFTPKDQFSEEQKVLYAVSDELVDEVKAADVIVIGSPVYNFNVPASLKLWIDQLARPGETFYYNDKGQPVGLLEGKKVILCMASAGVEPNSPVDFVTGYLRFIFGFMGIKDVQFVWAERATFREDVAETVKKQIDALI